MKKLLLFVAIALPIAAQISSTNGTIGNTIPGTAGGSGCGSGCVTTIAEEGLNLPQQTTLNFIGSSVTCVNNSGASRIDCTFAPNTVVPLPVNFFVDNGDLPIQAGNTRCSAYGGSSATINRWTIVANGTGSIQFGVWVKAFSSSLPTIANTIVASDPPVLTAGVTATGTALTGWTKTLSTNDLICVTVTSASTVTWASLTLVTQ